jgi:hypothetical protein
MSRACSWIVALYDEPGEIPGLIDDLHDEGFLHIGVIVAEAVARRTPVNLDSIFLDRVATSRTGDILAGGLAELHRDYMTGGLGAALADLALPREEIDLCLEAVDRQHVVLIVRGDDRYSEALAILNTHGARDTLREVIR